MPVNTKTSEQHSERRWVTTWTALCSCNCQVSMTLLPDQPYLQEEPHFILRREFTRSLISSLQTATDVAVKYILYCLKTKFTILSFVSSTTSRNLLHPVQGLEENNMQHVKTPCAVEIEQWSRIHVQFIYNAPRLDQQAASHRPERSSKRYCPWSSIRCRQWYEIGTTQARQRAEENWTIVAVTCSANLTLPDPIRKQQHIARSERSS